MPAMLLWHWNWFDCIYTWSSPFFAELRRLNHIFQSSSRLCFEKKGYRLSGSVDSSCTASGRSSECLLFKKNHGHPLGGSPFQGKYLHSGASCPGAFKLNILNPDHQKHVWFKCPWIRLWKWKLTFLHSSAPADWVTRHLLYTATCKFQLEFPNFKWFSGIDSNGNGKQV